MNLALKFTMTSRDLQDGSWLRVRENRRFQRIIMPVCGAILWGCVLMLYALESRIRWGYVAAGSVCFLWEDILFRFLNFLRVWVLIRRNPRLIREEVAMDLTDEGIHVRQQGTRTEVKWSAITGYRTGHHSILLFMSRDMAFCLPRRVLPEGGEEEFLAFLKQAGIPKV